MAVGKKKAAKKTKPSGPVPCAVLWGLGPSCGRESAAKGEKVRAICREMGLRVREVEPERLGDAAGAFAGLVGMRPAFTPYDGPAPECEFLLLCNLNNAKVDEFLARSREAGCVVDAKALLTKQNKAWPLIRLIEAVAAEHRQMSA